MKFFLLICLAFSSTSVFAATNILRCTSADGSFVTKSSSVTGLAEAYKLSTSYFNGFRLQNVDVYGSARVVNHSGDQSIAVQYIVEAQKATSEDFRPRVILSSVDEPTVLASSSTGNCNGPTYWVEEQEEFSQKLKVTSITQSKNQQTGAWGIRTTEEVQMFYCHNSMVRRTDEKPCGAK